jgi:hypothetical protein
VLQYFFPSAPTSVAIPCSNTQSPLSNAIQREPLSSNQVNPEDIQQLQQEGENNDTINSTTTNRNRNQRQPERIVGNPKDILCGRGLHICQQGICRQIK